MKLLVLVVYSCALVVQECASDFYPPVFWHSQNCVFRKLKESYGENKTEEFFMKVLPYNAINIICPNKFTVNDWLGGQFPDRQYENMWMVDKYGFDNCMVNENGDKNINKRILLCDDSNKIKYELFRFHNRYNSDEPRFAPGHHYYFISTSRGDKKHLDRKSGGHCKTTHMKLHIYVCDPKKEDCVWEMPKCDPPYRMMKLMRTYSRGLPPQTRPPVTVPRPPVTVPRPHVTVSRPPPSTVQVKESDTGAETKQTMYPTRKTEILSLKVAHSNKPTAKADPQADSRCEDEKDDGTSVHMVLNFVLGGVILFMAIVIIILACGLARKSSDSEKRPTSVAFSALSQEPSAHLYEETARFMNPPLTPLSRSVPQTPITNNPPFYFPPMSEIRPRSPPSKYAFNNSVYTQRRHSYSGSAVQVEATPMISGQSGDSTTAAV